VIAYQESAPCAELAPFVQAFWTISSEGVLPAPVPIRVVPDGCVDLIFASGRASVVGTMTAPRVVWADERWRTFAVRFNPGGAHAFLRVPLHELTDRSIALDEILGRADGDMSEEDGVDALQSFLLRRLPCFRPDLVDHALSIIAATAGQVAVGDLQSELGISTRHLERRFRERVGITPKAFCRVTRFQHAIAALQRAPQVDWLDLVHAGRFSDQAHFIREFRALSGLAPSAYRQEQQRVGFVQYSTASAR
jgi:AraC-like DNA-binding protein